VGDRLGAVEDAALFQLADDRFVRLLDKEAGPGCDLGGELAALVDRLEDRQIVFLAELVIVLAEGGGDVDDAGAVAGGDEIPEHDIVAALVGFDEVIDRLILEPGQFFAGEFADDFEFPLEHLEAGLGENQKLILVLHLDIVDFRMERQGHVRDQGPWRGRPDQEIGLFLTLQFGADIDRGVAHLLVALRYLMAGERSLAVRAVGEDFMALIDEPLLPELLEDPPDRFNIVVGISDVGILEIDPETDAAGDFIPLLQIGPDALPAFGVELVDAVFDDLVLAVQAEAFFDLNLHRQAVGIPAGLAFDPVALHGAQAADRILDGTGDDMMDARPAVGGRRAFEKDERSVFIAFRNAALKNPLFLPEFKDSLFDLREVELFG